MVDPELITAVTKATGSVAMLKQGSCTHRHQLHADEFEAFRLKPLDDLADEAPLHTVGLDGDEGAFFLASHSSEEREQFRSR